MRILSRVETETDRRINTVLAGARFNDWAFNEETRLLQRSRSRQIRIPGLVIVPQPELESRQGGVATTITDTISDARRWPYLSEYPVCIGGVYRTITLSSEVVEGEEDRYAPTDGVMYPLLQAEYGLRKATGVPWWERLGSELQGFDPVKDRDQFFSDLDVLIAIAHNEAGGSAARAA